ncbi:HamA C-terminal domain-containing protein [Saccharospirillum salsuginis]|uniref:Anti-bacteriophage protein A/HamA C-terminal domain-containing protein n=1 Tax=Saccharospirillum salsuginis TaxID=418750 RepID=A0A918K8F3_9GAMM|nr:DUF1837 domain-containing protein [Saccharospirillum salsuginis]GGX54511.1 hypothetical protein GCM10007392_22370 [Saccharospirillum salsuginis]
MSKKLQTQLQNANKIKALLKNVDVEHTCPNGQKVETLLVYLPISNGKTDYSEFFELIRTELLHNFVFSCTEIEKKLGVKSKKSKEDLFNKAIRKLSKKTAHGELGELIIFTLLDVYFEAPKILSKVSQKSNPKMPVFGADAVHGQFTDDGFILYLGESKLFKSFKSAATKATQSIVNAKSKYQDELDLLDSYLDFPGIDEETEQRLLELLDPFNNKDIEEKIKSPCFIGFAEPKLISTPKSNEEFLTDYKNLAQEYVSYYYSKVEEGEMTTEETPLLLLPFSDIEMLVSDFIDHIGIEK